jgi:hypothetical protein
MANPTTNYGWPMPTSTDLVTDLPADFAAFGQPVDTSLKALNPETTLGDIAYRSATSNTNTRLGIGTAGQVLAVSGGVPAWTTTADVTPLTTKGDLFTFTTVDARIGIGANNTVLTADSAEATGMKWATPAAGGTWAAWTPTYTGFSLGNGTITARYAQVGNIVTAYVRLLFGSTTSMAASNNRISLPVTASAVYLQNQVAGQAVFWDNSLASPYQGLIVFNSGTEVRVMANNRGTTYTYYDYAGSTVPVAYATSDAWEFIITYEAA